MVKRVFWALAVAAIFSLASCQKEEANPATDANVETAIDADEVDGMYDEVANEVGQITLGLKAGTAPDSSGKRIPSDPVYNSDGSVTKTVTFVNWKIGKNQRWVKNGQIIINLNLATLTRTVKFNNFTINGCKIEGKKTMVLDLNNNTLSITLENGKVIFTDGTSFTLNFSKVWTKVKGVDTPLNIWDDEYDISIEASGVNRRGKSYTETTTTPLHFKLTWPVFVSGEVKREVNGHTILANYGTGAEDFLVTITVDGVSKEIDLLAKK